MRIRVAGLVLALATCSVANAQTPQSFRFGGNDPIPVAGARNGGVSTGITEQGRGTVQVPAQRLRLDIRVFATGNVPGGTAASDDAVAHVVDALRESGVADARALDQVLGNITSASLEITGTVADPSHDKLAAIEKKTAAAIPSSVVSTIRNVQVSGTLEADSCAAALERARALAYADARARAESLAKSAGVRLGALANADETDQDFGCADSTAGRLGGQFALDETASRTDIPVSVNLRATFAILP